MPNKVLTLAQLVHHLHRCSVFLESIGRQEKKGEKCEIAYGLVEQQTSSGKNIAFIQGHSIWRCKTLMELLFLDSSF